MQEQKRFVVRKNTLPYIHQWAVLDLKTNNKIAEYKTQQDAKTACIMFEKYGLPQNNDSAQNQANNAWQAIRTRMNRPNGDPLPKPPRHSDSRRVELD